MWTHSYLSFIPHFRNKKNHEYAVFSQFRPDPRKWQQKTERLTDVRLTPSVILSVLYILFFRIILSFIPFLAVILSVIKSQKPLFYAVFWLPKRKKQILLLTTYILLYTYILQIYYGRNDSNITLSETTYSDNCLSRLIKPSRTGSSSFVNSNGLPLVSLKPHLSI